MHKLKIIIVFLIIICGIIPTAFGDSYVCSTTPFIGSYCFMVEEATIVDKIIITTYANYYSTYYVYTSTDLWVSSFVSFEYVYYLLNSNIPEADNNWY